MNAQSNSIEKALLRASVPYRVISGVKFYERKEIKDVMSYLSVLNNPSDAVRLARIINEPKRGIGAMPPWLPAGRSVTVWASPCWR